MSSPANGAQVASPVSFVASATSTCGSGVASMGIYVNNTLEYVTYTASMNTSLALSPGTYYTVVQEWDHCGGSTYTPLTITVVSGQSGVHVNSPAPNSTVTSPVAYSASASAPSCAQGVASMGIYVNGNLSYVTNSPTLNTSLALNPGSYNTVVQEWDKCGGSTYATVPINVAAAKGGVVVTSPAPNSTVSSPVAYVATASAPTCSAGVASMGIYVNNNLAYVTNSASMNTTLSLSPGSYNTVVQEWDKCGGSTYSSVPINVSGGQSTGVTVTSPTPGSTVTSPVTYTATATTATCAAGVSTMGIYVNNQIVYVTNGASLNTQLTLAPGAEHTVVEEWDKCGGAAYTTVDLNVSSGGGGGGTTGPAVNVTTFHMDNARTGLNDQETALTPSNVSSQTFGKLFSYITDGYAYAEPLLMSNVSINGATHNVVYVATEHDSVYAFDSDNYGSGAPLWHTSLLQAGEAPESSVIKPYQGITGTPVIDPSTGTLYVVSAQTSSAGSTFRLNALDIHTGAPKIAPVTINASVPGSNGDAINGRVYLTTACVQRAALLLANGNVYIGFGGCHSGWLLAYSASNLAQVGVFNASPYLNGEGAYGGAGGIWMGGGGPVADSNGSIYVTTGNGPFDESTAWGDSMLKFSPTLQLQDYFTPSDYAFLNCDDADLAAGGLMLIPGTTDLVGGGKGGKLYLVNGYGMGGMHPNDTGAIQTLYLESDVSAPYAASCTDASGTHTTYVNSYQTYGTPAYFNGSVYAGITPTANIPGGVRQYPFGGGKLQYGPYTSPDVLEGSYGITPFISSNGTNDGILWMIDHGEPLQNGVGATPTNAVLRAYDASDPATELYDSNMNSADVPGYGIKFTSPIVANGKVYMSSGHGLTTSSTPYGEIDVYGLK